MYTISGAMGDSFSEKVEALKRATEAAKASLIPKKAPAAASPVARLQNALRSLGVMHGDPTLSKLKIDGVVGPGTTKAVNYAIAQKYVVMPNFPRPELTVQHVRQFAGGLAAAVEGAVRAGGGSLAPIATRAPRARSGAGGGVPAAIPEPLPAEPNRAWVWWAVGGLGVLVVLSIAAKAIRGKSSSKRKRVRNDDED